MADPIRILFVGELHSSHAQSWIRLLSPYANRFSVQGVGLGGVLASTEFFVRQGGPHPSSLVARGVRRLLRMRYKPWADPIRSVYAHGPPEVEFHGLVKSLRQFNPHIVHTFGFTPAALLYGSIPESLRTGRWVLQTRGGSDVAYTHADPAWQMLFRRLLPQADVVLCDNLENYRIFDTMGASYSRTPLLPFVPGTGGIDLSEFEQQLPWENRENILVWNKAYESPWSKALPVLEGIRSAWDRIGSPECIFTAADQEMRNYINLLPKHIQACISVRDRVPRGEMLELIRRARVVLAPSLVDGVPNTLYEAMAAGAVPIVSPLKTFSSDFAEGENVFYARNLYPDEIAEALVKAFTSPAIRHMIQANKEKVARMADRTRIASAVVTMYETVADGTGSLFY